MKSSFSTRMQHLNVQKWLQAFEHKVTKAKKSYESLYFVMPVVEDLYSATVWKIPNNISTFSHYNRKIFPKYLLKMQNQKNEMNFLKSKNKLRNALFLNLEK